MTRMTQEVATTSTVAEDVSQFKFRFPRVAHELDQDREWFEVEIDDEWHRLRIHDYDEIFQVPSLYEALVYQHLKCCSPARVVGLLNEVLADAEDRHDDLRVLDVGAGNGIVGAELRNIGSSAVVGIDIVGEAKDAAMRDRPGVYDDYIIADLTDLSLRQTEAIKSHELNCLTAVASLGFDDIPPSVFIAACDLIDSPGWLAFNIKEDFLEETSDRSGFAALIRRLQRKGLIQIQAFRRYRHRLSVDGEPLFYIAMVATKLDDIPQNLATD